MTYRSVLTIIILIFSVCIIQTVQAERGSLIWERTYNLWTFCRPIGAVNEPDGGLTIVIQNRKRSGSRDSSTIFLTLDGAGEVIEEKRINLGGEPRKAIPSDDGRFIIYLERGMNPSTSLILKLDRDGQIIWNHTFEDTNLRMRGVIPSNDGYILGGVRTSNREIMVNNHSYGGSKSPQIYLIELDHDGEILWEKTFELDPMTLSESLSSMADCGNGETALLVKRNVVQPEANIEGGDAYSDGPSLDETTVVMKVDGRGNLLWEKRYPDWVQRVQGIERLDDGFLLAGRIYESYFLEGSNPGNLWAARLDEYGEIVWEREFESPLENYPSDVVVTGDDGLLISTISYDPITYMVEAGILKLDSDGRREWEIRRTMPEEGLTADMILEAGPTGIYILGRRSLTWRLDLYVARIDRSTAETGIRIKTEYYETSKKVQLSLENVDSIGSEDLKVYLTPIDPDPYQASMTGKKISKNQYDNFEDFSMVIQGEGLYQAFIDLDDDQVRDLDEPACWLISLPGSPTRILGFILVFVILSLASIYYVRTWKRRNLRPKSTTPKRLLLISGICLLTTSTLLAISGIDTMMVITRIIGLGRGVEVIAHENTNLPYQAYIISRQGYLPGGIESLKWLQIPALAWSLAILPVGTTCTIIGKRTGKTEINTTLKAGIVLVATTLIGFTLLNVENPYQIYQRGLGFWILLSLAIPAILMMLHGMATSITGKNRSGI